MSPVFLTMGLALKLSSYQLPVSSAIRLTAGRWTQEASRPFPDDIINNTVFLALVGPTMM